MPSTTAELLDLLDLEDLAPDLFRGRQPNSRLQRTFGGQVMAQAMVAAGRSVEPGRSLHSLHCYFLRPGSNDQPIIYDVEHLRDGRSFTTVRVLVRQRGVDIGALSLSFHIQESGLDHADPMPLDVPDPEQCPRLADIMEQRFGSRGHWDEWDALDVRFVGDSGPSQAVSAQAHGAHMRVWVRTTEPIPSDDQLLHRAALAYMSDLTLLGVSTVPHPVVFMSQQMVAASLDHAMWFHRDVRADQWTLYDQVSPSASGALGFSSGRLFQGGQLFASCSQEGLVRVVE